MSARCTPRELSMWDGDPVSLHPHPPVDSARRFLALVGADAILAEGRRAIEAAGYRWAAEILHKLVFAEPGNTEAKSLQADAYIRSQRAPAGPPGGACGSWYGGVGVKPRVGGGGPSAAGSH